MFLFYDCIREQRNLNVTHFTAIKRNNILYPLQPDLNRLFEDLLVKSLNSNQICHFNYEGD